MNPDTASPRNELSTKAAPRPGVGDRSDTRVHISLDVRDVATSVKFYEAFFGAKAHKVRPGYANFDLVEPPLKIAFDERPHLAASGAASASASASASQASSVASQERHLSHLGFQVATTDQVLAARRRLVEAGLWTFEETGVCCHAQQDKVWVKDPDGVSWEIYTVTDELLDADHAVGAAAGVEERRAASPMSGCCTTVETAKCC